MANAPLTPEEITHIVTHCPDYVLATWLHMLGPPRPWDPTVTTKAAQAGSLICLKYARVHGCPWDRLVCLALCRSNAVRAYILEEDIEEGVLCEPGQCSCFMHGARGECSCAGALAASSDVGICKGQMHGVPRAVRAKWSKKWSKNK
jgi:hypothetical protein